MKYVVVTTDSTRRGVFGGELVSKKWIESQNTWNVILRNAKMVVYWCSDVKGVAGLSNTGPLPGCKISPLIKKIELNGITAIMECEDKAIKNWEKETWN